MLGSAFALTILCGVASQAPLTFPVITDVEPLSGKHLAYFPADLPGSRRVIIVAFERDKAAALDEWLTKARALEKTNAGVHVVAAPIIGDVNVVLKSIILIAQRGEIAAAAQPRMMPLFVSREKSAAVLGLKLTDVAALVVNKRSEVIGRVVGPASDANVAQLAALLAAK